MNTFKGVVIYLLKMQQITVKLFNAKQFFTNDILYNNLLLL